MPRPFTNRTPPVLASRFKSKGGERFQRGYQYRYPQPFHMTLGPWNSVWPHGNRNTPESALQELQDGIIRDGAVYPIWGQFSTQQVDRQILGAFEFALLSSLFNFTFESNLTRSNEIDITYTAGGATDLVATNIVNFNDRIVAAPWQDKLYFSFATATTIYELDTTTDTVTPVANTPAAVEHMLIVRNRLVVLHRSGDSYEASWTVDSDPTDFLGIGASSAVLDGSLGEPQGFEPFLEDAMIMMSRGAILISSTLRNDPAFRFTKRAEISGARIKYAVSSLRNSIFYVGTDRFAKVFDGGAERNVGTGEHPFSDLIKVFTIRRLNVIAFTQIAGIEPTRFGVTLFLNPQSLEWTSTKSVGWEWINETIVTGSPGVLFGRANLATGYQEDLLALEGKAEGVAIGVTELLAPTVKTGRYYIGREVWIDRIDLIRTDVNKHTSPPLEVIRTIGGNETDVSQFSPELTDNTQDQDTYLTYHVNAPAKSIQLHFTPEEEDLAEIGGGTGPFLTGDTTTEQNIHADPGNPVSGFKGALLSPETDSFVLPDEEGNIDIPGAEFVGVELDENGNLVLRVLENIWLPNVGIERIEVYGSEQEVPFVSIG